MLERMILVCGCIMVNDVCSGVVRDGKVSDILPGSKSGTCNTYCIVKRYYKHATAGDFKGMIAEIYGEQM